MHDLLIRNGTVIDGTGKARFQGDVAVRDGKIVEVGKATESAKREINADGLVVSPGFIDPHTHYDGQICWDPTISASSWHGVTTVIMGNCGVGLAPCRPEDREIATWDLVNVEGIPFDVLKKGVTWDWESFPEYMDAADRRGSIINLACLAPLTPFRHYVMGEASMERAATPEETASIRQLLKEAIEAGACGFSTSTAPQHIGYQGRPLACRLADRAEFKAYASVLKELGKGTIELIANRGVYSMEPDECELLDLLLEESGRQITWLVLRKFIHRPDSYKDILRAADAQIRRGAKPQLATVPLITEMGLALPSISFAPYPSWKRAFNVSPEELKQVYASRDFRESFRQELKGPGLFHGRWDLVTVNVVKNPAMQHLWGKTVEQIANERGKDGLDTFFDLVLEDDLQMVYSVIRTEVPTELLDDPRVLIGESDGGAHVDQFCTAGYTSDMIARWVRETPMFTLERAIQRTTSEAADFFGIKDRGRLQVGKAADIVVFDYNNIACEPVIAVNDLPGGGRRMIMKPRGVEHVVVNGKPIYDHGKYTGEVPGGVLRSQA
ncbi:MAG TPA: amidohydrolase family protein [Candidatus Binataceae bacterium]|nr:amidohydrolase family protein [Candidatus Binataceae bacterium]